MEYLGNYAGYEVFRNSDGFLEGYKSTSKISQIIKTPAGVQKLRADSKRVVTNQVTTDGFCRYIRGLRKKPTKIKDIPLDAKNLPSLFD